MKCLAKSPDYRYPTGDDLRVDLLRFREGRAVGAVAPPNGGTGTTQHLAAVSSHTQSMPQVVAPVEPEEDRERSRTGLYAGILVVLLAGLVVVVLFLGQSLGWWHVFGATAPPTFAMPDVSGQSVASAEHTLQAKGLKTHTEAEPTASTTPNTQVIRTVPAKGITVQKGEDVTLVTGSEGPPVSVPPLVNQSVIEAKSELQGLGLQANVQFSSTCTVQNVVCLQSPKVGTGVRPGSTVIITTSPTTTPVPDVTGLSQATACNRLGQAGFQCGDIVSQSSNTVPQGDVISTNPVPGTQEPANTSVNLVVSKGPSTVIVQNVIGDTYQQAQSTLSGQNLTPVLVCQTTNDPSQDGIVQSQNPAGGTTVGPQDNVTITYSRAQLQRRRYQHDDDDRRRRRKRRRGRREDGHQCQLRRLPTQRLSRAGAGPPPGADPRVLGRNAPAAARKLASSPGPSGVRMDSGWNCTPSTGRSRWRSPMTTPSEVSAVTSSTSGSEARSTTSEW